MHENKWIFYSIYFNFYKTIIRKFKFKETKKILIRLQNVQIDFDFVETLKKMYRTDFPKEVKQIVSLSKDTVFYSDLPILRGLSHKEIINVSDDMSVNFIEKRILPLFDIGDNDYIIYDIHEKTYYKFNITDEVKFDRSNNIYTLIKK